MPTSPALLDSLRRQVRIHRRTLAAILAAAAVLLAIDAARAGPEPSRAVVAAADDLPSGRVLTGADLERIDLPVSAAPEGAVSDPDALIGRVVAAPRRAGSVLTDLDLQGPGLLDGYPEATSLVTIEPTDASALPALRVGDVVDVVGTDPRGLVRPRVLARRITVAAVPDPTASEGPTGAPATSGGLVVAVDRSDAAMLAGASTRWHVAVAVVR
ncbi:Flp pilus assembly protein CpaB [Mumia flava]|uniref:Flp pilus assembly protein CpaB n=1 Tax=Mumia flava TaxID=1348852 RepID=A0A2M9BG40_9ACTN|nr:SAF domain-containing protein [Mumia flava]PJJ56917.1 Flp pilus assembly protein CpaB [Mumia flava]